MKEILTYYFLDTCEAYSAWFAKHKLGWLAENWCKMAEKGVPWGIISLLVLIGAFVLRWGWKKREQHKRAKDLHPYYSLEEVREALRYFIPTRFQSTAPSWEDEPSHNTQIARELLIPKMLKEVLKGQDKNRFHIVLAGSGMGKTTFMLNLYVRYKRMWKPWGPKFDIRLLPLAAQDVEKKIQAIKNKGNCILLLDALDEDLEAIKAYQKRLDTLILGDGDKFEGVNEFREVLITCRTQFFPSEKEEPHLTKLKIYSPTKGHHSFQKYYLSPFSPQDIKKYIRKRFPIFQWNKQLIAVAIMGKVPDLMARPMLLSRIHDLVGDTKIGSLSNVWSLYRYSRSALQSGVSRFENPLDTIAKLREEFEAGEFTTFSLYQKMIHKWIERECISQAPNNPEAFRENLYKLSQDMAQNMYQNREVRKDLFIPIEEMDSFLAHHPIKDFNAITLRGRSLLNRGALSNYKFAHKSVFEFFLAEIWEKNPSFRKDLNFQGMDFAQRLLEDKGFIFPEMVEVEGGSFQMGSNENSDEKPIHQVSLSSYEIGRYPITQAQWEWVMGSNPSFFQGCAKCPVEQVSWEEVQQFINKLNQRMGASFRLPTEAEWEYAARGGQFSKGFVFAGSDELNKVGWFEGNSEDTTHPVGEKQPNELGVYDMSGNVWEWCQDWYGAYPETPLINPMGPDTGQSRVLRGGSWYYYASRCRVSYRYFRGPSRRDNLVGFRLARDVRKGEMRKEK